MPIIAKDIICKQCGKIFVCFGFHWIKGKKIPCTRCDKMCAKCYTKKIHSRLELVQEMNPNCYPDLETRNPSRRES